MAKVEKISIDLDNLELALYGISDLLKGMRRDVFDSTLEGIVHRENGAFEFLDDHYYTLKGMTEMIEAFSNVVTDAIANGEIAITGGHK